MPPDPPRCSLLVACWGCSVEKGSQGWGEDGGVEQREGRRRAGGQEVERDFPCSPAGLGGKKRPARTCSPLPSSLSLHLL